MVQLDGGVSGGRMCVLCDLSDGLSPGSWRSGLCLFTRTVIAFFTPPGRGH